MNEAKKWYNRAMAIQDWTSGLPEATATEPGTEGTVTIHVFDDNSEILSGHGGHWTREEWANIN